MLAEDPRRTHLPQEMARIASLYIAANQPIVQPSGRPAQAARGVVAVLERDAIYEAVVVISPENGGNVVYTGPKVEHAGLRAELEDALAFAESMGFMMEATGWARLDEAQRAAIMARIPAFRAPADRPEREVVSPAKLRSADPLASLARLLAAFCALLLASCTGMSAEQRRKAADVHQELGDNLLSQGDPQQALKEYLASVEFEDNAEAHLGMGLIYAWSLGRPLDGEKELKKALELKPDFSEAMTNLGALYLSRGRFSEAVPLLQVAARDPLYRSRVLAQSNLGWAFYKSGQVDKGVSEIKGALAVAPKYCLGWRQLGTIYSDLGRVEEASDAYGKYAEACPDVPDAHLNFGKALARQSKAAQARAEFERCAVAKDDKEQPVAAECARFLRELGTP